MYSQSVYARALDKKERAVKYKKQSYSVALSEAQAKCEELEKISLLLKKNGAVAAQLILAGDSEGAKQLANESISLAEKKKLLEGEIGVVEPKADCAMCNDSGYIKGHICPCVEEIAKQIAIEDLAAQAPLKESRFDNFNLKYYSAQKGENGLTDRDRMTSVFEFCKAYAKDFTEKSQSLLFLGGTGLGKTHLSLAIAGEAINKGYGVLYSPAQNLFNQMNREHFSYSSDSDRLLQEVLKTDLLIIDDLGAEFSTQFTVSCVYNIVNTRMLKARPTIISSNFTLSELEKIYSPRVMSRIIGTYAMKSFAGADIRQIKALEKLKNK